MPQPATDGQKEFFNTLLNDKTFADGTNKDQLRAQFAGLDTKNASAWIERAIELPDAGDAATVPAPF